MDKTALIDTACDELLTYGLWDVKTKAKRWVKKYVFRKSTTVEDMIFWPVGLLAAGLWHCRQEADPVVRQKIEMSLSAFYARWEQKHNPIYYIDDLIAGEVFLAAYEEYSRSNKENNMISDKNADRYREAVDKFAAYVSAYPRDEIGNLPYRANQNNGHIYVDAVGMICPFLYEYGRFMNKSAHMELAVNQIVNFLAYGMDGATGLPYHGYVMQTDCKYGIIGWGRAAGWLLRGMSGCMITEYGAERLRSSYIRLIDTVIGYQRQDGYFSWQLQALDGPADTSATGMICATLKKGIELGILTEDKYRRALHAGTNAIGKSIRDGRIYDCSGECEGFGQYPQRYGTYPWALGPALML